MRLRFIIPLVVFVVMAGFLYRGLSLEPEKLDSQLVGKPVPKFTLPRLDQPDQMFSSSELSGKVKMINVWASWCESCQVEHPFFMQLARSGRLPIYGLNYKDARDDALQWLKQLGNPYTVNVQDESGRVGIDFGVYGVPETYLVDGQGIVRLRYAGPVTSQVWQKVFEPLIKQLEG